MANTEPVTVKASKIEKLIKELDVELPEEVVVAPKPVAPVAQTKPAVVAVTPAAPAPKPAHRHADPYRDNPDPNRHPDGTMKVQYPLIHGGKL